MKRDDTPMPITFMDDEDQEREHYIRSLGELMLQSYADGDLKAAAQWLELQRHAISQRSPEQIARMESCYFSECGAADRAALGEAG